MRSVEVFPCQVPERVVRLELQAEVLDFREVCLAQIKEILPAVRHLRNAQGTLQLVQQIIALSDSIFVIPAKVIASLKNLEINLQLFNVSLQLFYHRPQLLEEVFLISLHAFATFTFGFKDLQGPCEGPPGARKFFFLQFAGVPFQETHFAHSVGNESANLCHLNRWKAFQVLLDFTDLLNVFKGLLVNHFQDSLDFSLDQRVYSLYLLLNALAEHTGYLIKSVREGFLQRFNSNNEDAAVQFGLKEEPAEGFLCFFVGLKHTFILLNRVIVDLVIPLKLLQV